MAAHLGLAVSCGAITQKELIHFNGRVTRGPYASGIIIDDAVGLQLEPALPPADSADGCPTPFPEMPPGLDAPARFRALDEKYLEVGLVSHSEKAIDRAFEATFWGGTFDGVRGLARAPLVRVIPLAILTGAIARLGYATVALLHVLSGSWISVYIFRRRMFCVLDLIFAACRGRMMGDVIQFSNALRGELFLLAILTPLAVTDMRASPAPWYDVVDASDWGEAHCRADIPPTIALELQRHCVVKGRWARMLRAPQEWLRRQKKLGEEEELPGVAYKRSPLWISVTQSLQFRTICKRASPPCHINIKETRAQLLAEEAAALERPDSRLLIGGDSQVALGAVAKGRAASPALNEELQQGLPNLLGAGLYPAGPWLPSATNPSDDPTRDREVRAPVEPLPEWWQSACRGQFEALDRALAEEPGQTLEEDAAPLLSEALLSIAPRAQSPRTLRQRAHLSSRNISPHKPAIPVPPTPERSASLAPFGRGSNPAGKPLSVEARTLLAVLPAARFRRPPHARGSPKWRPSTPGFIDLFSGSKRVAKALIARGAPWVLTYEVEDGASQDLLLPSTRKFICALLSCGAVLGLCAAPVCASFSIANTPPIRTSLFPRGAPWAPPPAQTRMKTGNSHSRWIASVYSQCVSLSVAVWVENPRSSWLWRQREWVRILSSSRAGLFTTDFCRWGTPWRKRTRFVTNIPDLLGISVLCACDTTHVQLRGSVGSQARTLIAQPYPPGLADMLALSLLRSGGISDGLRRLDIDSCAAAAHTRAQHKRAKD